jgi:hypothetical protein
MYIYGKTFTAFKKHKTAFHLREKYRDKMG